MSITVTVSNPGSVVSDTATIEVETSLPPESVEIDGPMSTLMGMTSTYTASVDPISTTLPVTYVWQATGQETVTNTGGLTDTISYIWMDADVKTITMTASNLGGWILDTYVTDVRIGVPEQVEITGPANGVVGIEKIYYGERVADHHDPTNHVCLAASGQEQ